MAKLSDDDLCGIVAALVKDAEKYRDDRSEDRQRAMIYYDGDADDLNKSTPDGKPVKGYIPFEEGRSKALSRDVRSAIKKVLPSVYRTILGNDEVVEYQPVGEGDEDAAQQATDYVNYVVLPECDGRQAIEDAMSDAIRLRNGIIKWWLDERVDVQVSLHTGLDDMAFAQLVADDEIEVLEHSEGAGEDGQATHDVRIKRRITTRLPKLAAIAPENWLIHPDAIRLTDSPVIGENCKLRRSDLVKMGYEKDAIWAIPATNSGASEQEIEEDTRRRDVEMREDAPQRALDEIDYYDLLVRVDQDGDGIAELRRMIFAGGLKSQYLLENVEWDEIHYADIVSERRPHQWEGTSVPDDVMEIQKIKTVLLRETLDNIYWQNALQPVVQEGSVVNPDSVLSPSFGKPIRVKSGTDVRTAINYNVVPMVADKSFSMLAYMDEELTDRTGISDASSGMAPDALQNMTAKASAMVEAAGIGQTEMMVRTIANSLKPVFKGLLKLVIQHQDKPRTIRLRDKWVKFDPRSWNASMDATVNTGLGAGTRERDMMAMQQVIALQQQILAQMGPAVGMQYVSPDNLYNAIAKLVQAAGLKSVGLYFTKPDPQALQQAMSQKQPSPEEIKAQAALQLEEKRTQGKVQVAQVQTQAKLVEAQAKLQADAGKEAAQRDADLATTMAEMDRQSVIDQQQIAAEQVDHEADRGLERERMALDYRMHQEELQSREAVAQANAQAAMQKAAMSEAGKAQDREMRAKQPSGGK